MQIFIKTLTGNTLTLGAVAFNTIAYVKSLIQDRESIRRDLQHLTFAGKLLEDGRMLLDYGSQHHTTVHLSMCLCGGKQTLPPVVAAEMILRQQRQQAWRRNDAARCI